MWNETIDPNARSYLRVVTASGTTYSDYDGSLDIQSAVFSSAVCSSTSISVGSVNVAQVLFTYTGAINLLNQAITMQYSQDGRAWYNVGVFTIVDSATSNGVTTATGYDALYWWSDTVPTTRQTSAQTALQWLCSSSGVELETLPTPDVSIDYDFAGCSYSMALGYLCALWGRNALINRNGKLELVLKKTPSTIPDLSDAVYSGQDSTQSGDYVVSKLVNTVNDTTTTRANTLTGQTISLTNPLLNETTIDRTWAQVNGLRYRGGAWTLFGWQQLEAGDVVTVNGNQTLCLQLTKVYDGGWKTTLTAPAELPTPVSSTVATARAAAQLAAQAQATAATANSKIDGLNIGGVNLFKLTAMADISTFVVNSDTDFSKPFAYYNGTASGHSFLKLSDGTYQDTITLKDKTNIGVAFRRMAVDIGLDPESEYTISCWAKCSVNARLGMGLSYLNTSDSWVWRGGTNLQQFTSVDTWQFFTLTFKPDADTKGICYCFTVNAPSGNFTIKHCKLERGNKATDWSPAPEDVNSAIDTAQSAADAAQSTANSAASVASTAQSTANSAASAASTAQSTANTANSKIDNLQIGGVNLLLKTAESKTVASITLNSAGYAVFDPYYMQSAYKELGITAGEYITLSFDWDVQSAVDGGTMRVGTNAIPWEYFGLIHTFRGALEGGHFVKSFCVTDALASSDGYSLRFRFDGCAGMQFTISNAKLERGNKATDWSPAPEDVNSAIDTAQEEAAKTATNYMDYHDGDGLTIGNMADDELGKNVNISADAVNIRDGTEVLASFKAKDVMLASGKFNISASDYGADISTQGRRLYLSTTDTPDIYSAMGFDGQETGMVAFYRNNHYGVFVSIPNRYPPYSEITLKADRYDISNPDRFRYDISAAKVLATETKTVTVASVPAGDTRSGSIDVSKSGYTALGVVGWQMGNSTGNSLFAVSNLYISGNQLYYSIRNTGTNTDSATLTATVLYG